MFVLKEVANLQKNLNEKRLVWRGWKTVTGTRGLRRAAWKKKKTWEMGNCGTSLVGQKDWRNEIQIRAGGQIHSHRWTSDKWKVILAAVFWMTWKGTAREDVDAATRPTFGLYWGCQLECYYMLIAVMGTSSTTIWVQNSQLIAHKSQTNLLCSF